MAGVVLDARAEAELAHHLEVEGRPLAQPLGLELHAPLAQLLDALLHLLLDVDDGLLELLGRRDVVRGGIDVELVALGQDLAGQRVELGDPLDLVAEELDAHDEVVVGGLQLERVAADAEAGARQRRVVALVLQVDQLAQDAVAPVAAADAQPGDGRAVVDGRAEAVDAGDGLATMIVSRRSNSARVAAWRSLSISSLRDESFSMYVSERGRYASGW